MSGVPVLQDEINRKGFETVEWLFGEINAGRITPHQFSTAIDALWMAINGLVSEDIAELMTAGDALAPKNPAVDKRIFCKSGQVVVLRRTMGEDYFTIILHNHVQTTRQQQCTSSFAARDAMIVAARKLLKAGFEEL